MRYTRWYMDHKGKVTCDGVHKVINPSTYFQTDANGEWQPVPFYETYPKSPPSEGFFMVRVPNHG